MSENLQYIEAYFQEWLTEDERKLFESRCTTDADFAKEVAFYISVREAARETLLAQKRKEWQSAGGSEAPTSVVQPLYTAPKAERKAAMKAWWGYAVAACVLFIIAAVYFLLPAQTPQQLAAGYIQSEEYTHLSQLMDASADSVQLGIEKYNQKQYPEAISYFKGINQSSELYSDAVKYAGLSYLQLKEYDKALYEFDKLSAMTELHVNSGTFLSAITLLQRNKPGDKDKAKTLLEEVVRKNEEGTEKAQQLLDKW